MSLKLCLLVAALLVASASLSLGYKDPELQKCEQQCKVQAQFDEKEAKRCIQQHCQKHGGDAAEDEVRRVSPEEKLKECSKWCEQKQGEQRLQCQSGCRSEYEREREEERERHGPGSPEIEYEECRESCTRGSLSEDWKCERKCEKRQPGNDEREEEEEERETEQKQGRNPYVFEDRHFFTGMQTQHGRLRILQKFTERSRLLRALENWRVAILEAQPQTFIVPSHWDAETIVFVANGKGTVSSVIQERRESLNTNEKRESFNIKEGDIFRVKAGTTTYLINRDNNEKLILVKLIQPVSTPGEFEAFYGAGGENPESFYRAFSNEILEAAFNTRSDRLERLFGQQQQGAIIKASEEQIRGMSRHEEGGVWPFRGSESKSTNKHNLYEQRPTQRNQYGQLYEVDSNQFRQLRDLDVAVSLANISRGAMTAPYYNSRATKISVVVKGQGYFEMACPHQGRGRGESQGRGRGGSQGQPQGGTGYQKIQSDLKVGTVFVVPAGHPYVTVASNNQNLQLLCFEINAYNNQKYTLAGKGNVMRQLEREAKELAFGVPAREVDEVFNIQQEEFFFKGPRQQHQGHADA